MLFQFLMSIRPFNKRFQKFPFLKKKKNLISKANCLLCVKLSRDYFHSGALLC